MPRGARKAQLGIVIAVIAGIDVERNAVKHDSPNPVIGRSQCRKPSGLLQIGCYGTIDIAIDDSALGYFERRLRNDRRQLNLVGIESGRYGIFKYVGIQCCSIRSRLDDCRCGSTFANNFDIAKLQVVRKIQRHCRWAVKIGGIDTHVFARNRQAPE